MTPPKTRTGRVRLNLALKPDVYERLQRLLEGTECETSSEVVRRALGLYEIAMEIQEGGGHVDLVSGDGETRSLHIT